MVVILSLAYQFVPLDSDGDLIPDHVEDRTCTDYLSSDTDGDGLSDGLEMGQRLVVT